MKLSSIYCGEFVYDANLGVDYILTPVGQMTNNSGTFTPQFNITDHLGNVRSVVNSSGAVLQSTDYYPFGLAFADNNVATNRYLFNGKELENYTLGTTYLGTLDYGARHYDPRIARWTVPDPMVEKYYGISGYVYCANNPMNRTDATGMWDDWIYNILKDEYIWDEGITNTSKLTVDYEYIGPSLRDVQSHYISNNPIRAIFKGAKFGKNITPWVGEITNSDLLTTAEMWMESPSNNMGEGFLKIIANIAYNPINSAYSLFSGKTFGGKVLNSNEKMDSFVNTVPGLMLFTISRICGIIKPAKGLKGFNQFIRDTPGATSTRGLPMGMRWQTRAGQLFQKNKIQQQSLKDFDIGARVISINSDINDEIKKQD